MEPSLGSLGGLPEEVVRVLFSSIDGHKDALQLAAAHKELRSALKAAPVAVKVADEPDEMNPASAAAKVAGIANSFPGCDSLSLSDIKVLDHHLPLLLVKLPNLRLLHFHSCKKLSSKASRVIVEALVARGIPGLTQVARQSLTASRLDASVVTNGRTSPAHQLTAYRLQKCSRHALSCPNMSDITGKEGALHGAQGLEALAIQKCYQMTDATLAHVMRLATLPAGRSLRTVCLSYIEFDGDRWLAEDTHGAAGTSLLPTGTDSGGVTSDDEDGSYPEAAGPVALAKVVAAAVGGVTLAEGVNMTRFIGDQEDMEARVRRARVAEADAADGEIAPSSTPAGTPLPRPCSAASLGSDGRPTTDLTSVPSITSIASALSGEHLPGAATSSLPGHALHDPLPCHVGPRELSTNLSVLALHYCKGLTRVSIQAVVQLCPHLHHLYLGGSEIQQSASHVQLPDSYHRVRADVAAHCDTVGPEEPLLSFRMVELLTAALQLPALEVLEVTFLFPEVYVVADTLAALAEPRGRTITVWDFTQSAHVLEAVAKLEATKLRPEGHPIGRVVGQPDSITQGYKPMLVGDPLPQPVRPWEHLRMALYGAVNCRSTLNETPLHVAAAAGNLPMLRGLLALGADIQAKGPRRGSSALFLACEKGYALTAAALLQAGADPWAGNKQMETPIYISALMGNLEVVQVLLSHFAKEGTEWWASDMYGDGWTPLMAVAVSNRVPVAKELLSAAERQRTGAGAQLALARNQYGQTAAHICARKNQCRLLRAICHVAGQAVVGVRDSSGRTALDVALSNCSKAAELLLREYAGDGGAANEELALPGREARRRHRHRQRYAKNRGRRGNARGGDSWSPSYVPPAST